MITHPACRFHGTRVCRGRLDGHASPKCTGYHSRQDTIRDAGYDLPDGNHEYTGQHAKLSFAWIRSRPPWNRTDNGMKDLVARHVS